MDEDSGCNKDEIKQMGRDLVNWIKSTYAGSASIKDRKFSEQFSRSYEITYKQTVRWALIFLLFFV